MNCSKCGAHSAQGVAFCRSCSAPIIGFSIDRSYAPPSEPSATPGDVRYAGFWRRAAAASIDILVLAVPVAVVVSFLSVWQQTWPEFLKLHPGQTPAEMSAAFGHSFLVQVFVFFLFSSWLYFAWMESSGWQATLGKRMLALRVTDKKGRRVSFWRASLRFAGGRLLFHVPVYGLPYFTVDCFCAGLTRLKQAVHDKLAGCLVISSDEF